MEMDTMIVGKPRKRLGSRKVMFTESLLRTKCCELLSTHPFLSSLDLFSPQHLNPFFFWGISMV